jgi:hypothetical protein
MDTNKLLKALDDDTNEQLLNFTTKKLIDMNLKIIMELQLNRDDTMDLMRKLKGYKYVDELDDLKYGTYIRWIPISNPEVIHMKKGAIFCEVRIEDEGVYLVCKNFGYSRRHFRIKMDENLIFQKLNMPYLPAIKR